MISWPAPSLPAVPGAAIPVELYDRLTDRLAPVRADGTVRTYACGLTPYDSTHLGHAATYLAGDLLHRVLIDNGTSVLSVQNITDIDDPLLERADRDGVDWQDLAADSIDLFRDDLTALAIIPPTHYLGVVESMPTVTASVRALIDRGVTYALTDESGARDVYLDVSAVPADPAALSGLSYAEMVELSHARGGDPDRPGKRDPIDPLLWRGERPGEPAWDGGEGLGPGRPGWHIECTALAWAPRAPFDLQIGGADLVFAPRDVRGAGRGTHRTPTRASHPQARRIRRRKMSNPRATSSSRLRESGVDRGHQGAAPGAPLPLRVGVHRRPADRRHRAGGAMAHGPVRQRGPPGGGDRRGDPDRPGP